MSKLQLAGCIITDSKGRILLMHRSTPQRTQWEIPGGKINPGEAAVTAAVRELKEELGVDVTIIKPLGSKEFIEDGTRINYTWYMSVITSGRPVIMEPQTFDDI
ncbi:MAG TPA: NUDIX hydrolase, partial [Candidatus Limnocylindrales bacterium]|nr:NUDIX hydrolase [Candidatus Limnocylindrales bacterium]